MSRREGTQSAGRGLFSYRHRTPGVSGSAEGLESQGEGRQCLNPFLMKTLNRDTLKYW